MRSRWRRVGSCGSLFLAAGIVLAFKTTAGAGESDRPPGGDARALAATIDRLIAAHWDEAGVKPASPADDAEFLRRASLDLSGKIPAAAEVREFLDDPRADKRARPVDRLLDRPPYFPHFSNIQLRRLCSEADLSL